MFAQRLLKNREKIIVYDKWNSVYTHALFHSNREKSVVDELVKKNPNVKPVMSA